MDDIIERMYINVYAVMKAMRLSYGAMMALLRERQVPVYNINDHLLINRADLRHLQDRHHSNQSKGGEEA